MTEYDGFRVDRDADRGVATITLDVPGKLNRVSMLARDQLAELFAQLDGDESVRFVVLTGAGGQFTAGGDIAGFLTKSPWVVSQLAKNVAAPERCAKPVIAQLEGYVFGVGLELALACDFRIAADDVQMALPEATIGMIPGSGGTQRLARLVGVGRAKDIIMRGRRVKAEEALAIGLVTEVLPPSSSTGAVAGADRRARPPLTALTRDGEARPQHGVRRPAPRRASSSKGSRTGSSSRRTTSTRVSRPSSRSESPSSTGRSRRPLAVGERTHGALGCAHRRRKRLGALERRLRAGEGDRVHLRVADRVQLHRRSELVVVEAEVLGQCCELLLLGAVVPSSFPMSFARRMPIAAVGFMTTNPFSAGNPSASVSARPVAELASCSASAERGGSSLPPHPAASTARPTITIAIPTRRTGAYVTDAPRPARPR